jgi:hypothetical protein
LNSVELPPSLLISSETSTWDDVRRIYRRVCLLRTTGKTEDADRLENSEFAHALSAARIASNSGDEEAAVLAKEAERVASACVLAELLAPLLAERLRADAQPFMATQTATVPVAIEKPVVTARPPAQIVPSIADLIDGMLSQQAPFPAIPSRH